MRASLLLPVGPAVTAYQLGAAVDVLVRTAPEDVELDLRLVLAPNADDETRRLAASMSGDVSVQEADLATAAASAAERVVLVDPAARPELTELPQLLTRLDRDDDPLPFVHRLGLLVCRRDELTPLAATPDQVSLIELAARLGRSARSVPAPEPQPTLPAGTADAGGTPQLVSVVVGTDAPLAQLDTALALLRRHSANVPGWSVEFVLVDAGGDFERSRYLRTLRWARVVAGGGLHSSMAGVRVSRGEVVVLVDARMIATRRWLAGLLAPLASADVVAVGPRFQAAVGHQQQRVRYNTLDELAAAADELRRSTDGTTTQVAALSGRCLAIRRDALVAAGGLDASLADPDLAALDLSLRMAATTNGRLVVADGVLVHLDVDAAAGRPRWHISGGELARLRARHGDQPETLADRHLPGLVSALLIVKDEEANLARSLESVSGVVDEVIVCDTGSADGTALLAEALGARVTTFAWCDDFGAARNACAAEATTSWGLQLDADERLDCPEPMAWRAEIAATTADVLLLPCVNRSSGVGGADLTHATSRLLRIAECHWHGRIHEQIVRHDNSPATRAGTDAARLLHDGYQAHMVLDRGKAARNNRIADRQDEQTPNAESGESGRVLFERGRARLLAGDDDAAETLLRQALSVLPAGSLRRLAACLLAKLALKRDRPSDALELTEVALDGDTTYPEAVQVRAVALLQLGERNEARELLRRALSTRSAAPQVADLVTGPVDDGVAHGILPLMLAAVLLEDDQPQEAWQVLEPLARTSPDQLPDWRPVAQALRRIDDAWAERLAELAQRVPERMATVLNELSDAERAELVAAFERRGVPGWRLRDVDDWWRLAEPDLRRMSRSALVAAARQWEGSEPARALRLWEFVWERQPGPDAAVGRARCLQALGEPSRAADAVDGLDPDALEPVDRISVAALAAELGDFSLAASLLDELPDSLPPDLLVPAQRMRETLLSLTGG